MIIGITGSLGSGKSTVSRMFARLGVYVIDVDELCHSLIEPYKKTYKNVVKHFGKDILKKDRSIDRKKLADIVFKQRSKLKLLNSIVHPAADIEITKLIKKHNHIIIDAAVLIESGLYKKTDAVLLVLSDKNQQFQRLVYLRGMTKEEIANRISMQLSLQRQRAFADFIIDNSGSKKQTFIQVKKIWKLLGEKLCQ